MNGRSRDLSQDINPSRNKFKPRSFNDQRFDNVCFNIPYDHVEDPTKSRVKLAIESTYLYKFGKLISKEEQEVQAKILYEKNGLDWYEEITNENTIDNLLEQASCKDNYCRDVPEKDSSESKHNYLLDSAIYSLKKRLKEQEPLIDITDNQQFKPIKRHFCPNLQASPKRVQKLKENTNSRIEIDNSPESESDSSTDWLRVEPKRVQKRYGNKPPPNYLLKYIWDTNRISNNNVINNNSSVLERDWSTNFPLTDQLSDSKKSNIDKFDFVDFSEGKNSLHTLFDGSRVKKPRMMNDYREDQDFHHVTNGDGAPYSNVATLLNMGNTCFLNSVLYTLRFAPTFLHNLHHLLVDLSLVTTKLKENRNKTSSLGRNGSAVSGSSWRSASSKDLLSIGTNDIIPKTKEQIVTEKLHALFVTMNNLETKDSPDPYQPEALLQAIRDANPLFEGNHQQDAHEFFVELLSCLRMTCDVLNEQIEQYPDLIKPPEPASANVNNNSKIWGVRRSWKPLKKKEKVSSKKNGDQENEVTAADSEDNLSTDECGDSNRKKFGYNFIAEDFQGVSLHRTKCLECEEVSELKEPFLEIQVPVTCKDEDFDHGATESSIFGSVCVTSEKLCDQNKYFCEICNRYNEAVRTVLYEKLPNIMVLHLKRFTTSSSGVQKVNTFVPTPLEIRCFCESCNKTEKSKTTPHKYRLTCVIMHLGASMASGHYIAYSRASVQSSDYIECTRDIPKNYLNPSGKELSANILKFFKAKALGNALNENQNGLGPNSKKNDAQVCQSITCCGIRSTKLNLCSPVHSDDWLEFDDEKVKTLSKKEFIDMLNRRQESTHTPYLLFYSKV